MSNNILEEIIKKKGIDLDLEDSPMEILEALLDYVKRFILVNVRTIDQARTYHREKRIVESKEKYDEFRNNCITYLNFIVEVEIFLPKESYGKIIISAKEVVVKSTERKILSKMPVAPVKYLEMTIVTESEMDWIFFEVQTQWIRFTQIYGNALLAFIKKC